jgi:transmembrane sensor
MESAKETEQHAARWLAQRDSGHWTTADQTALEVWLNESAAHAVAYLRLEAAWARADRFKALGAGCSAGTVPTPEALNLSAFFTEGGTPAPVSRVDPPIPLPRRARVAVTALAASVLVALTLISLWYFRPAGPDYITPVGGTASVPMIDGSTVTLNTDSAIRVSVTDKQRQVELDHGEAFFEVAKDPRRPFVVSAGDKHVIAVGTKFSVRRVGNDIRVSVTEGKVRVDRVGTAAEAPDSLSFVPAGGVANTKGSAILVEQEPVPAVEESLSWRTGYLVFHEESLNNAAAEFNRYNVRKIVIDDPRVATIRLSGRFRTTEYQAFVRLLEDGFPIRVRQNETEIVLTSNDAL